LVFREGGKTVLLHRPMGDKTIKNLKNDGGVSNGGGGLAAENRPEIIFRGSRKRD